MMRRRAIGVMVTLVMVVVCVGCTRTRVSPEELDVYFDEGVVPPQSELVDVDLRFPDPWGDVASQYRTYVSAMSPEELCEYYEHVENLSPRGTRDTCRFGRELPDGYLYVIVGGGPREDEIRLGVSVGPDAPTGSEGPSSGLQATG